MRKLENCNPEGELVQVRSICNVNNLHLMTAYSTANRCKFSFHGARLPQNSEHFSVAVYRVVNWDAPKWTLNDCTTEFGMVASLECCWLTENEENNDMKSSSGGSSSVIRHAGSDTDHSTKTYSLFKEKLGTGYLPAKFEKMENRSATPKSRQV